MAQVKATGTQLDIPSIADDIINDPTASASLDTSYFRVDGTSAMAGSLDLNSQNLINVAQLNGVDPTLYVQSFDTRGSTTLLAIDGSGASFDTAISYDFVVAPQHNTPAGSAAREAVLVNAGTTLWEQRLLVEADVSDLQSYLLDITGEAIGTLSDVTITSIADRHVLVWDGITNNRFDNRLLVKADVSDFSDGDYATAAQGATADSATQPLDNISTLTNNAFYQDRAVPAAANNFAALDVNGDMIDSTFASGSFATAAQGALADSATQPADNISTLTNNSNFIDSAGAPVQTVNGASGTVVLVASDVGLGNVDNTADASKPVSTAQQSALDLKSNIATPVFTGTVGFPTYTVGTLPAQAAGHQIYVSDATGIALTGSMCFSNGTVWIDVTTGGAVI